MLYRKHEDKIREKNDENILINFHPDADTAEFEQKTDLFDKPIFGIQKEI
jgi:hypothetical protein